MDGDKFVCMDQLLARDQCVVYSFGLAADWTFEDQMDLLGELSAGAAAVVMFR